MNNAPSAPVQLDIFHNTIHLRGEALKRRRLIAAGQCRAILDFFRGNPAGLFTPFDVQMYAGLNNTPITSIRRAINTLTNAGYLVKTELMKEGGYGVNNHTWKLA